MKRIAFFIIGVLTLFSLFITLLFIDATQVEVLTVDPLTTKTLTFNLSEGDIFSGSLAISGGANNDINFWITDPQGNTILNLGRISQGTSFEFTAKNSGAYTLHFDNSFSIFSAKQVSLSYDIKHSFINNFILLIILGIISICVIIAVLMLILHRKKTPKEPPQQYQLQPFKNYLI